MFAAHNKTPPWPSLYDPLIEFHDLEHHAPIQPGGRYLTHAGDVFRFTLYWMLIFLSPFFLITGGIASFNIIYPPQHDYKNGISSTRSRALQPVPDSHSAIPLTPLTSARSPDLLLPEVPEVVDTEERCAPQPRKNVRRSRITYALFTLLAFLVTVLAASFFWSAVIGYVLWALFRTGDFNISTWLPPVWALIIACSVVLGAFPSVINRI